MAPEAITASPRPAQSSRLMIVLVPVSHPELDPIHIHENLFAIGRLEAPFDSYPDGLAADLSRRHARIFCEHGAIYLAELGSKNGSTVNGVPLRQGIAALHDGDVLGLGKTLAYRVRFEQAALQPPAGLAKLASLTLRPEDKASTLQPIVVSEFPFMVSKIEDSFARYKDVDPSQVNYLSRRHAHLFLKAGRPHVEDLGSTNGTFVNGVRLEEHAVALHEGDLLAFGGRHFVYRVGLQWEAAARDPTLTLVKGTASAPALDAERTTFVAAADSFLDIFCVDPAPEPDAADVRPAERSAEQGDAAGPPQGKAAAMLAGLHAALGGKGPFEVRRVRRWGAAALGLVVLLAMVLYGVGRPAREVEALLADGAYAEAAARAEAGLAGDPGNSRLQSLGLEALLKARLPAWMASVKTGDYAQAKRQVAAMRRHARNNPELGPLLEELDWIVGLESFVASRGGAQAPVRDARDGARIEGILKGWDEQNETHQRAFETMAAHVPAFRDTYADALSDLRRLALARSSGEA